MSQGHGCAAELVVRGVEVADDPTLLVGADREAQPKEILDRVTATATLGSREQTDHAGLRRCRLCHALGEAAARAPALEGARQP